jgi:hypothetical protein
VTQESRPVVEAAPQDPAADHPQYNGASRQVSWWDVHEYVQPLLTDTGSWPAAGTPAWCVLADDDPRKLAAVFDAAQHFALRVETSQVAMAEASHEVSGGADWSHIAQQAFRRACAVAFGTYIPRMAL